MTRTWTLARALVVILLPAGLLAASLQAQSDKITLPRRPAPNQSFSVKMTQDVDMAMTVEGEGAPTTGGPMKTSGQISVTMDQKIGAVDATGLLPVEVTYTDAGGEMTVNGQAMKLSQMRDQVVGKSLKLQLDAAGGVSKADVPEGLEMSEQMLRQMWESFAGRIPATPLAVGEKFTMPLSIPMPIPVAGEQGTKLEGTVTTTLAKVEGTGANRLAYLDQVFEGGLNTAVKRTADSPEVKVNMKMSGTGRVTVDLARGVMPSGDTTFKINGEVTGPSPTGGSIVMKMDGTMHMVQAEEKKP